MSLPVIFWSSMALVERDGVPGQGAIATVDGHRVVVGSRALMDREGIDLESLSQGGRPWRPLAAP